jgi:predicted DCC family thiol-disulfide oxidoreductase YuxK
VSKDGHPIPGDDAATTDARDRDARAHPPVLLYDGMCGFCDRTVQFVLARDPDGPMRFAMLQGEFAASVIRDQPALRDIDSLIVVEPSGDDSAPIIRTRSDAAIAVGRYVGGGWSILARIGVLVPRPVRDAAYDLFARHRYRFFGRRESCRLPASSTVHRFMA